MDILQLKQFQTVALEGTISKAAFKLGITQPALSTSLLRLEKELGIQLFDRKGRKIALNEYGERYLNTCEQDADLLEKYESRD